ncbi:MAG: efflux RND transporter periplasmic adaptor subunit [Defluviicoccus sp.]|nr:MAG: efflux RND transporter periplasmic adaptor subunit [Defluviicoccus sp.]
MWVRPRRSIRWISAPAWKRPWSNACSRKGTMCAKAHCCSNSSANRSKRRSRRRKRRWPKRTRWSPAPSGTTRAYTLAGQGNLSQQALDRALSDQLQAEATLRKNEAELRQAQIDLGYTRITAPFDGRIGRSTYSPGQWVGPDSGVLATLVKLDPIYVVFNVSERSCLTYRQRVEQAMREGQPKPEYIPRLKLSNGTDYEHTGRLTFVDNQVDPGTGTIAVRAEFPNPEKLLVPGLFVTVLLEPTESKSALLIPQAAVQEDQGGHFVLVVGADKTVEIRHIETGARIGVQWEVISGLNEGEQVIYEGIQKARPGAVVAPVARPSPRPPADRRPCSALSSSIARSSPS